MYEQLNIRYLIFFPVMSISTDILSPAVFIYESQLIIWTYMNPSNSDSSTYGMKYVKNCSITLNFFIIYWPWYVIIYDITLVTFVYYFKCIYDIMYCFIALNMSRNERHRADKRASSSRARSKGILINSSNIRKHYIFLQILYNYRLSKKRVRKCS